MDIAATPAPLPSATKQDRLMAKATELEAAFLAEMLAHAGLGESAGSFSGGAGEAQFASCLRQEQARLIVKDGGLGLAELIFNAMTRSDDAPPPA